MCWLDEFPDDPDKPDDGFRGMSLVDSNNLQFFGWHMKFFPSLRLISLHLNFLASEGNFPIAID